MYLMYVDGNGDPGANTAASRYFVLTGLVVHESFWRECFRRLVVFRKGVKAKYGLPLAQEIHAGDLLRKPGSFKREDVVSIFHALAEELAAMPQLSIINVVVDKLGKDYSYPVFINAWSSLLQRFDDAVIARARSEEATVSGMVFSDQPDSPALTRMMRYSHLQNTLRPARQGSVHRTRLATLIEDPNFRDSAQSYYVQAADVAAFLLYQYIAPGKHMGKRGRRYYFHQLDAILDLSEGDTNGITWL